jgi:hypothetical protein
VTWEVNLYREDEAGYRLCCEPFGDSVKCLSDEGFSVPVAKCGLLRGRRNWVFGWGRMRRVIEQQRLNYFVLWTWQASSSRRHSSEPSEQYDLSPPPPPPPPQQSRSVICVLNFLRSNAHPPGQRFSTSLQSIVPLRCSCFLSLPAVGFSRKIFFSSSKSQR